MKKNSTKNLHPLQLGYLFLLITQCKNNELSFRTPDEYKKLFKLGEVIIIITNFISSCLMCGRLLSIYYYFIWNYNLAWPTVLVVTHSVLRGPIFLNKLFCS